MSALHTATCHFYHDSCFRRFCLVYKLRLLLVTFCLWFVVVEIAATSNYIIPKLACRNEQNTLIQEDRLWVKQSKKEFDLFLKAIYL